MYDYASTGRIEIYTDAPYINSSNVIKVLQNAMPKHLLNANRCDFLLRYEAGEQPNTAIKTTRKDIQSFCPDNLAHKVTEFKLGFNHGFPITLVQRGEKDSGQKKQADETDDKQNSETDAIALLNEQYEIVNFRTKSQQYMRFSEICWFGYVYVDINMDYKEGVNAYFTYDVLDPRTTFIVKSSRYPDHRDMLGVSYREDEMGNRYFTCFTDNDRFEISNELKITNGKPKKDKNGKPIRGWFKGEKSGEKNPLEVIPIIRYIRSHDGMGCFEHQIHAMDDLNALRSQFMNGVSQSVNTIWHFADIDFPKDENNNEVTPKSGDMVRTFTSQDGKAPKIEPLIMDYNYEGLLNKISYDRGIILEECDVPARSGGNTIEATGVAVENASGWSAAELAASKQQCIIEDCKMREVRVVLAAIAKSPFVPQDSPLLKLRWYDAKANVKRTKNYELTIKANFIRTLIDCGFDAEPVINEANAFTDPAQVLLDSREGIEAYQKSRVFGNSNQGENATRTTDGGMEAQISNSPHLDGLKTGAGAKAEV